MVSSPSTSSSSQYALAFDVGGTNTKVGFVDRAGTIYAEQSFPTPTGGATEFVSELVPKYRELLQLVETGQISGDYDSVLNPALLCPTVGVAVPGVISETRGYTIRSANLGWGEFPMQKALSDAFDTSVILCHDVRSGAVGESRFGGSASVFFVPIGTGIAAGLVLNGHLITDLTGTTGEIGQVLVPNPDLRLLEDISADLVPHDDPYRSARVPMEKVASAKATGQRYRILTQNPDPSLDSKAVFALEREGDVIATHVVESATAALAEVLAICTAALSTVKIIIGGGQANEGEIYRARLEREIAARLVNIPTPVVALSKFGSRSQLLGVAAQAFTAAEGKGH